jgi:hypothetical protein
MVSETPDSHVVFELEPDEDGWPPVGAERVWATHLGGDAYRIENPPWFVRDLAVGDVVEARPPDADSHPVFVRVLEPSDHITVRLVVFERGPLQGDLARAMQPFVALGAWGEGAQDYAMVALDIESSMPLAEVRAMLVVGERDGSWAYEEGRITDAWVAARR